MGLSGIWGYGDIRFVITLGVMGSFLTFPPIFGRMVMKKEKNMTTKMIHEIMQEMFDNDHCGGLDYVESSKVNKIIQSYFPKAFESFEPAY